jgi:hypothetical protein
LARPNYFINDKLILWIGYRATGHNPDLAWLLPIKINHEAPESLAFG